VFKAFSQTFLAKPIANKNLGSTEKALEKKWEN